MPPPTPRRFRVTSNRAITPLAFELTLEPADGQPMFLFIAGQWVMLHLLNEDGTVWAKAPFSIVSAPCESEEAIKLTIKVYGAYTQRAQALKVGDEVGIQGPYGVFVLPQQTDRLVFIAGGIGITPLRSMLREALHRGMGDIYLIYSEKDRASLIYEAELRALTKEYPNFHLIFTLTQEAPADWGGEKGRINREMLMRCLPDFGQGMYFMCGPGEFMDGVREALATMGVDVKKNLKKEIFT